MTRILNLFQIRWVLAVRWRSLELVFPACFCIREICAICGENELLKMGCAKIYENNAKQCGRSNLAWALQAWTDSGNAKALAGSESFEAAPAVRRASQRLKRKRTTSPSRMT
jgi:hypothetical protein